MSRYLIHLMTLFLVWTILPTIEIVAGDVEPTREEILQQRMSYYLRYDDYIVPWYYIAAIDQYERNIQDVRNDIPKREGVVSIQFSDEYWSGALNPK